MLLFTSNCATWRNPQTKRRCHRFNVASLEWLRPRKTWCAFDWNNFRCVNCRGIPSHQIKINEPGKCIGSKAIASWLAKQSNWASVWMGCFLLSWNYQPIRFYPRNSYTISIIIVLVFLLFKLIISIWYNILMKIAYLLTHIVHQLQWNLGRQIYRK